MRKIDLLSKIIYILIFTVFAMFVFILNIGIQDISFYDNSSDIHNFFVEILLSFKVFDVSFLILGMLIFYTFYNIYFDGIKITKKSYVNMVIAVILTFITIIGESYKVDNTLNLIFSTSAQIVKCMAISIGYYLLYYAGLKKFSTIKLNVISKKKTGKLKKVCEFIDKFQIPITIIVILLGWLPYIVYFYPGASTGDTFDCLCQFFHLEDSWSIHTINLLSKNVYINKHHSVLFTVIMGVIFKLGYVNESYTVGAFLFTIFQVIFVLVLIVITLNYMKKIKVPLWIRIFSILFFAFTPTIVGYVITAVKDTPSAVVTLIYVVFLVQIIRDYNSIFTKRSRLIVLGIIMLLVMMLRNNGIFAIILSFPFLVLIYKDKWEKITIVLLVVLSIFCFYDKIFLTKLNVTSGSIKEVLTIPFMQVARVAYFNEDEFEDKDIEKIDKVLQFALIKSEYDPDLADSVKDTYEKNASKKELMNFFSVWFKYFKRNPIVYTESVINSTYGYFFPEVGDEYAALMVDNRVSENTYFNISDKEKYKEQRETIEVINDIAEVFPVVFLFNHVAFYSWFLIFSIIYVIGKKQYKYLIALGPLISILLMCVASPINGSFRYMLPVIMSLPMILVINFLVYKECIEEKSCNIKINVLE